MKKSAQSNLTLIRDFWQETAARDFVTVAVQKKVDS
jgi:hypothetical protein